MQVYNDMKKDKMRIAFAGTHDISASILNSMINNHYTIVAVYTQPDKPSGRGKKINLLPVKTVSARS